MNAIETQALTKYYGKARGIVDVTLKVKEGDFFGFAGPNGAGKSTTIRTLLGLIRPSSGSASVLGHDILKEKQEILRLTGYLPSETAFYPNMRVKDVLEFSAKLRKKDCAAEAKRLCDRLDLDVSRRIKELSLGNRKKVGIVCAMQHDPKLYILDEPTSGLDPLMQQEFYAMLREKNEAGATIFLSSHALPEIAKYCRAAAVIREGHIAAVDSVENFGHTGVKKVVLRGVSSLPEIAHVKDATLENGVARFWFSGEAKELISSLSELDFSDLTVTDPDFDEVFLHFYEKEENKE